MYASDVKHPTPDLEKKLNQLYRLRTGSKIDLSFRPPYLNLLSAFGNPHLSLPPVIHVAGTNGKGSTIAILHAILKAEGYRVHAYTSPHLERFNERIVLAGQPIEDGPLESLIDEALMLNNNQDLTFFEITTAMAFAAFSRVPADICLIETGLGGRLDCTNVIKHPLATIITAIGYDHTEFLGETLSDIAAEKAGIIKPGGPCIIAAQSDAAKKAGVLDIFKAKATKAGAPLYSCDDDWIIEPFDDGGAQIMRFVYRGEDILLPMPNLEGSHQINNAGAALAVLKVIHADMPTTTHAKKTGLRIIKWQGRLQKLEQGTLTKALPRGWGLYLDGGHNESAGHALAHSVSRWCKNDPQPMHLILGMMTHKDPKLFITPLLPYLKSLSLISIDGEPQSHSPETLLDILKSNADDSDVETKAYQSIERALNVLAKNKEPGRIIIAGSLYLVGNVLRKNRT